MKRTGDAADDNGVDEVVEVGLEVHHGDDVVYVADDVAERERAAAELRADLDALVTTTVGDALTHAEQECRARVSGAIDRFYERERSRPARGRR